MYLVSAWRCKMKKIIDGLRFNTENAIEIGSAGEGFAGDLQRWVATLYKTPRSGRFFIAGSGGPMSRFAQSIGQNQWSGGSDLIPMSEEDALAWAEKYLDADTVERYFAVEDA
jgi:hypothetical protein